MKKHNEYDIEQQLMAAFTHEMTDAEIGIPDIEAELQRVHSLAESNGKARSKSRLRIASIAACVAVLLGIGFATYQSATANKGICIAYVGGDRIMDEAEVMRLMADDMSQLNSESDIVEDQLSTMFNE